MKSLTAFPQVLTMMNEKLDWTQKLGDIFLAQQKDVMDGVQRLRAKAKAEGNLESSKEQTVTEEPAPAGSSTTTIIQVQPANPQVVYVPTYNPTVVYGAWPYPAYPPYYPYPPGYAWGTAMLSFGIGMAVGGALWGNCNWGNGDVDIDVNNNFNRNTNINRNEISNKKWEHNGEHRKGAEYRDKATPAEVRQGRSPERRLARRSSAAAPSRAASRWRSREPARCSETSIAPGRRGGGGESSGRLTAAGRRRRARAAWEARASQRPVARRTAAQGSPRVPGRPQRKPGATRLQPGPREPEERESWGSGGGSRGRIQRRRLASAAVQRRRRPAAVAVAAAAEAAAEGEAR